MAPLWCNQLENAKHQGLSVRKGEGICQSLVSHWARAAPDSEPASNCRDSRCKAKM